MARYLIASERITTYKEWERLDEDRTRRRAIVLAMIRSTSEVA